MCKHGWRADDIQVFGRTHCAAIFEPCMRVAFSKSGTSQVTNSHASTENVQKNSARVNHTDIEN